jgi:dTMP kinase
MARGLFIVLEGGEGVGKTTQWTRLANVLRQHGHDVRAMREPGGTVVGDALRAILLDPASDLCVETEAFLFNASRAQLVTQSMLPALDDGAVVLVDRFLLSTYAYQGAGRGLPFDALRAMGQVATRGLVPDLTLLLHMPLGEAMSRANARSEADRMERESHAFHTRVADAFVEAATPAWQAAHPEVGPVALVDARGEIDAVLQRCLDVLAQRWPQRFRAVSTTPPAGQPAHRDRAERLSDKASLPVGTND